MRALFKLYQRVMQSYIKVHILRLALVLVLFIILFATVTVQHVDNFNQLASSYKNSIQYQQHNTINAILNCRSHCAYTYASANPDMAPQAIVLVCNMACVQEAKKDIDKFISIYSSFNDKIPQEIKP